MTDTRQIVIDIETTGLPDAAPGGLHNGGLILEVGMVLVGQDLAPISAWSAVLGHPHGQLEWIRECCSDRVRDMHDVSGLWDDCAGGGDTDRIDIVGSALDWLREWGVAPGTMPLTGSSVRFDRTWLNARMPELEGFFHYRIIDVSSIRELAARWYPGTDFGLHPEKKHRVIPDCLDTIAELKAYRDTIFRAPTTVEEN